MTVFANKILALLTVIGQIGLAFGLVYLVAYRRRAGDRLIKFWSERGLALAFSVALLATLGSLFYSEIAGFVPCELCWYQRIAMYPQVLLLGLAWLRKEKNIIDYSLILVLLGFLVSLYHNYLGWTAASSTACAFGVSCLRRYVFEFGYITIPLMALTAFALLILILGGEKILKQNNQS